MRAQVRLAVHQYGQPALLQHFVFFFFFSTVGSWPSSAVFSSVVRRRLGVTSYRAKVVGRGVSSGPAKSAERAVRVPVRLRAGVLQLALSTGTGAESSHPPRQLTWPLAPMGMGGYPHGIAHRFQMGETARRGERGRGGDQIIQGGARGCAPRGARCRRSRRRHTTTPGCLFGHRRESPSFPHHVSRCSCQSWPEPF